MDEQFATRDVLDRETLRRLQTRADGPSLRRFALHALTFAVLAAGIVATAESPWLAAPLSVLLAGVWAAFFAPFHECTHRTAFTGRRANAIGAWIAGIPFGLAPRAYRCFHFEHHRHTHEPGNDPEIVAGERVSQWSRSRIGWLRRAAGLMFAHMKIVLATRTALLPVERWERMTPWATPDDRARIAVESRVVLAAWAAFALAALTVIPGGGWLLLSAALAHPFLGLWLSAEHTGLPHEGSVLERTRSVRTNGFVRFWLWNMSGKQSPDQSGPRWGPKSSATRRSAQRIVVLFASAATR